KERISQMITAVYLKHKSYIKLILRIEEKIYQEVVLENLKDVYKVNSHIKCVLCKHVIENGKIKIGFIFRLFLVYGQISTRISVLCDLTNLLYIQNFVPSLQIGNLKEKGLKLILTLKDKVPPF
ncbi:hypothetical protein Anas_13393, partial [Armadillidium nasatum]